MQSKIKKLLTMFFVVGVLLLAMTACGGNNNGDSGTNENTNQQSSNNVPATTNTPSTTQQNETTTPTQPPVSTTILDLSLTAVETTVNQKTAITDWFVITSNGTLQSGRSGTTPQEVISENVRTFANANGAIAFIRDDNTLWTVGDNRNGLLGDGTGVDQSEPVLILENAAIVAVATDTVASRFFVALQTDGTLWFWGDGTFEPLLIDNNVVDFVVLAGDAIVYQLRSGEVYGYLRSMMGNWRQRQVLPYPVRRIVGGEPLISDLVNFDHTSLSAYINTDNVFILHGEEITDNAYDVIFGSGNHIFILKTDGSLWGMGNNSNGELGDGTKVPRDEPVHIADNVVLVHGRSYLRQDGTLWTWTSDNPTPQQEFENVATFSNGGGQYGETGFVLFQDGTLLLNTLQMLEFEGIRIPQFITFN